DTQVLAERGNPIGEFVIDFLLDEHPRAGATDLAGIGKYRHRRARHRGFDVSVGKDDVGRFAAELKRYALKVAGRRADDRLAGDMRAGKRDLVDTGVSRKRCARCFAVTGTDIDDAWRTSGLQRQLAEPQRSEWRLLGRLEDHGTASGERRTDLPNGRAERTVPRDDGTDNADRLLERVREYFSLKRIRDGLAVNRGRLAGVIAKHAEHAQPH